MAYILRVSTNEGVLFKKLIEIYSNSFTKLIFNITQDGIYSRMSDSQTAKLFDLELLREQFTRFELATDQLFFSVNILHIHKIISSMKKKDTLTLQIRASEPTHLELIMSPKERDYVDSGFTIMEPNQVLLIDLPEGYTHPIQSIQSKFSKMCKELSSVSKEVRIRGNSQCVSFTALIEGVMGRETVFRPPQLDPEPEEDFLLDDVFRIEDLLKISKISSLGSNISFYVQRNLPFKVKVNIGTIGRLTIYIRSKQDILSYLQIN